MAGSRDIKAGKAAVEIIAETDPLKRSLANGSAMLRKWGSNLGSVSSMMSGLWAGIAGGAAAGLVASSIKSFVSAGSALNDMAARTGKAATDLQHLKFAASQTGASMEDLEIALRTMARKGFDVAQFEVIGQRIAAIKDPSMRAAQAMEVFGKSGTKMLPMFAEFNALKAQSEALGPILSANEVKLADELGDKFDSLQTAIKRAGDSMVVAFGPEMRAVLDTAIGMVIKFADLMKTLRKSDSSAPRGKKETLPQFLARRNNRSAGGDWLDKFAEFRRTSLEEFKNLGAEATSSAGKIVKATQDEEEITNRIVDKRKKAADAAQKAAEAQIKAHESRNQLIKEFETPAEKFISKMRELFEGLRQLEFARNAGFISGGAANRQAGGLATAAGRLRQEEMNRLREEAMKQADTFEQQRKLQERMKELMTNGAAGFSSQGTFSAAGAAMLGRSGDPIQRESLKEEKQQTEELRKIRLELGKLSRPAFT